MKPRVARATSTRELGRGAKVIEALLFLHIACFRGSRYKVALNMSDVCSLVNSCHQNSRGRATKFLWMCRY